MEGDFHRRRNHIDQHGFQSTPSAWRETDNIPALFSPEFISIHSLRMEGDCNSHTVNAADVVFQSTPSAWRETSDLAINDSVQLFQSTPSAWRETYFCFFRIWHQCISIHSLRMEGDLRYRLNNRIFSHFNPLPPHGGRR